MWIQIITWFCGNMMYLRDELKRRIEWYVTGPLLTYLSTQNGPPTPKICPSKAIYKVCNNFPDFLGKIWRVKVVAGLFCYSIHIPDEWSGTCKSSDINHMHFKCFLIDKLHIMIFLTWSNPDSLFYHS